MKTNLVELVRELRAQRTRKLLIDTALVTIAIGLLGATAIAFFALRYASEN